MVNTCVIAFKNDLPESISGPLLDQEIKKKKKEK
ncbi:MAG: hypothetical protein ACI9QN_001701 [Arcticibacterium sp.]|jgi:hypothetical protein